MVPKHIIVLYNSTKLWKILTDNAESLKVFCLQILNHRNLFYCIKSKDVVPDNTDCENIFLSGAEWQNKSHALQNFSVSQLKRKCPRIERQKMIYIELNLKALIKIVQYEIIFPRILVFLSLFLWYIIIH